jgi:hypothetical protein
VVKGADRAFATLKLASTIRKWLRPAWGRFLEP